jgi:hypothetical protein
VAEGSNAKHEQAAGTAMSLHEAEAERVRQKTARLRELRLAKEAADKMVASAAPAVRRPAAAKKSGKPGGKGVPLSEWLNGEQTDGRRN